MIFRFLIIGLLGLLITEVVAQNNLREVLEQIIKYDTEIDHETMPGFIVAVIDSDSTFIESFGMSLDDNPINFSEETPFQIGGLSKVLTSLVTLKVLDENNIPLNSLIGKHVRGPLSVKLIDLSWTFETLLNHTTGLPKNPEGLGLIEVEDKGAYENYNSELLEKYITDFEGPTNNKFQYGHLNHALLTIIIENISKTSFDKLLNDYLLDHIGNHQTFVFKHTLEKATRGYTRGRQLITSENYNALRSSLGIQSNLHDMSMIVRFLIEEYSHASSANAPLFRSSVKTEIHKRLDFTAGLYLMNLKKKYSVYTHSGRSSGHYAFIGLVPETTTGVVILANSVTGTEDLGLLILRMLNDTWKRKKNG